MCRSSAAAVLAAGMTLWTVPKPVPMLWPAPQCCTIKETVQELKDEIRAGGVEVRRV